MRDAPAKGFRGEPATSGEIVSWVWQSHLGPVERTCPE